jgi:hypothetical protein
MHTVAEEKIPTPLADEYATRPRARFTDIPAWIRVIERRASVLESTLAEVAPGLSLGIVLRAKEQLADFLRPGDGRLSRLIARPPEQLDTEAPARRIATELSVKLLEKAERVTAIAEQIVSLATTVGTERAHFAKLLPNLTHDVCEKARIHDRHILALSTRDAVQRAGLRWQIAREFLQRYEAAALEWPPVSPQSGANDDSRSNRTIDEFRALLTLSRRTRGDSRRHRRTVEQVRRIAVQQLDVLASLAPVARLTVASAALDSFLSRANELAARRAPSSGQDAVVSAGALGAATRAGTTRRIGTRIDVPQFSWRPSVSERPVSESDRSDADAVIWGATVLAEDIICFSRNDHASFRLFNVGMRIGGEVEIVPISGREMGPDSPTQEDARALFEIDDERAGWFSATRRARVLLLATDGEYWFARLLRKGRLERKENSGAKHRPPAGLVVRFLGHADESMTTAEDVIVEGVAVKFGGVQRLTARTGLQHAEAAVAHVHETQGSLALVREREVMHVLQSAATRSGGASSGLVAHFIGAGNIKRLGTCFLYRAVPDLQFHQENGGAWLTASEQMTFTAVASLALIYDTAWQSKWSLGSCHLKMFGFSPRWDPKSGEPMPVARLLTAPFATPIDQPYILPCSEGEFATITFDRLRIAALSSRIKKGEAASIGIDMLALLTMTFDLLAIDKIEYGEGHRASWGGIVRVAADGGQFRLSSFVALAAAAAMQPEGREVIAATLLAVSRGAIRSFSEWHDHLSHELNS